MPMMKAIITCVDYDDFLKVTLPLNKRHFSRVLVVTTAADKKTLQVVLQCNPRPSSPVSLCDQQPILGVTKAFYKDGAKFNKGRALEESFDSLGRDGWIMVLDADTILPNFLDPGPRGWEIGNLYSPYRRMCEDPSQFTPDLDWSTLPYGPEKDKFPDEMAGYCQIFHAANPVLQKKPWYPLNRPTAEWCDGDFYRRFPRERRIRPAFEVLHLGPPRVNWAGRVTARWR